MKIRSCVSVMSVLACASVAFSQGAANNQHLRFTQEHGYTFSTIGDAGNRSYNFRGQFGINYSIGAVDYEYRIATTETTVAQYAQFVDVYRHFVPKDEAVVLAGRSLQWLGNDAGGSPAYGIPSGWDSRPAFASFRYFARMANWMHHGSPDLAHATHETFTTGAYNDTVIGPRASGAQVWIPSWDEWVKAAYWDPNRNGPGEGGYWLYPDASDTPLTPGDPGLGGETNAGAAEWPSDQFRPWDVGSYGDVQTPWGLLDASGGGREWTDSQAGAPLQGRYVLSSNRRTDAFTPGDPLFVDNIEYFFFENGSAIGPYVTVRFAAAIPAPGVPALLGVAACAAIRRRR